MVNHRKALLIVDVQEGYTDRQASSRIGQVVRKIENLQQNYSVVLATQKFEGDGQPDENEPTLSPLAFVTVERAQLFEKETSSAATPNLVQYLVEHDITEVVGR